MSIGLGPPRGPSEARGRSAAVTEGGGSLDRVAICEGVGGRERKWAIGSAMTNLSLLPRHALLVCSASCFRNNEDL